MARPSSNAPARTTLGVSLLVLAAVILIFLSRAHWNRADDPMSAAPPSDALVAAAPPPTQMPEPDAAALDRRLGQAPLVNPQAEPGPDMARPDAPPSAAPPASGGAAKDDGEGVYLGGLDDAPM